MLTGQRLSSSNIQSSAQADQLKTGDLHRRNTTPNALLKDLARTTSPQRGLAPIIKKCVAPKREKRYRQVPDLLAALEPFRAGADLPALVERTGWRPSIAQK